MTQKVDLINKKFGRLTVFEPAESGKDGRARWKTECECGKIIIVRGKNLLRGNTTSCGCRKKEGTHTTHGLSKGKNRIYNIWLGMKQRCNYKKAINYKNYGGRGIKVCERWKKFENFFEDMDKSYKIHLKEFGKINTSLDRIDNEKGYSKENCKWSTKTEQYFNSRSIKN